MKNKVTVAAREKERIRLVANLPQLRAAGSV